MRSYEGMMGKQGERSRPRLNMHQPAVFCVRLQGAVDEGRIDYFDA